MKIAVISDIHGNYVAFEKCLEDAKTRGVNEYLFLGDYLGEFPYPRKTIEILHELQMQKTCFFVRGNKEDYWINRYNNKKCDWVNGNESVGAMKYCYDSLTKQDIDFFESMEMCVKFTSGTDGKVTLLACHGTPENNKDKFIKDDPKSLKLREAIDSELVVVGHTHIQGVVIDGPKKVVNAGAVGVPFGVKMSTQYLVLEDDEYGLWRPEFVTLPYDAERVIGELHESGLWEMAPHWCRVTENLLRNGTHPHAKVLYEVMKADNYIDPWYNIPDCYWDEVLEKLGI